MSTSKEELQRLAENKNNEIWNIDFHGNILPQVEQYFNASPKITLNPSMSCGKIKRNVNGVNNGPPLYHYDGMQGATGNGMKWRYRKIKPAFARLHDDALISPGSRIVDVQRIFANFHADVDDPRNYYFEQTDDYIKGIRDCGTDIVYRLGPSIEHTVKQYDAHEPADHDKWADICIHIIKHYNEGWANGFNWNIKYWEIWNEPWLKIAMWMEPFENFCRFYAHVAKRIKAAFPNIKIGSDVCGGDYFFETLKKEKAPWDFHAAHGYFGNPTRLGGMESWLDMSRKFGFNNVEFHLNEWHYLPVDFFKRGYDPKFVVNNLTDTDKGISGANSAALVAYALILFQDLPVDVANFYAAFGPWGLIINDNRQPHAEYNAFKYYAKMLDFPQLIECSLDNLQSRAMAGMDDDGNIAIMLASFESDAEEFKLDLSNVEITDDIEIHATGHSINEEIRYPMVIKNGVASFAKYERSEIFLITGLKKR